MPDNLQIQEQLNKLLREQQNIVKETNRVLQDQVNISIQMVDSLKQSPTGDNLLSNAQNLKIALQEAAKESSSFAQKNNEMSDIFAEKSANMNNSFEELISNYQKAKSKAGIWGNATASFISGISGSIQLLKNGLFGVLSLAGSVASGMFSIGKSILSIPFKIFNAFVNEANRLQGEPLLAREFEETRAAFGDFKEDLSKNVIQGYKNLRGELAETGLSTFRVLGLMHERLKFVREQFQALGPVAHEFGMEIAVQSEHFAAYQKGLGLSGEMMKGLAQATQGTGMTLESTLRTTTKFTTGLGKQFGISQKVIGRDIGEMSRDLKNFGSIGIREMAQMSVYARKLGTDFKDLLGVVSKFDNFEDAAESAARLAQAFGMNVNAMEMINEQDPAARIEMLRKAFYRTGKDITKLSRQERNYLAQTAGIEDQALNSVFALEKQGMSYEDIQAAGEGAEKQQISQAEAMKKLSDSIERMIKSGSRTGGFFDRFVKGFKRGLRWAGDFRQVMRNIKRSLWAAERAGRRVGQAFVKYFPGVKDFLKGVKEFFNPEKFRKMATGVSDAFTQFFKDLSNPVTAEKALNKLLKTFKELFFEMAGSQTGAMSKIISGFKQGFKAVGQIILSAGKIAIKHITTFMKGITLWLKSDKSLIDSLSEVFDSGAMAGAGFLNEMWFQISKQLGPSIEALWKAFQEMMGVVWDKTTAFIGKKISDWWNNFDIGQFIKENPKMSMVIATVLFGGTFKTIIGSLISQAIAGGVKTAAGAVAKVAVKAGQSIGQSVAGGVAEAGIAGGIKKAAGKAGAGTAAKAVAKQAGKSIGTEVASTAAGVAGTGLLSKLSGWMKGSGSSLKGLFTKFGKNIASVALPIMRTAAITAGAALGPIIVPLAVGAAVALGVGYLALRYKYSQLRKKENAEIAKNQDAILEKSVKNIKDQKSKNLLLSKEVDASEQLLKNLKSRNDLDTKQKEQILQQLLLKQQMRKNAISEAIVEEEGYKMKRGVGGGFADEDDEKEFNEEFAKRLKKEGINTDNVLKELELIRSQKDSRFAEIMGKNKKEKEKREFTMEDISFALDKAEALKPEEIKKLEESLRQAKELLLKDDGIVSAMNEIKETFKDFGGTDFLKAAKSIEAMSSIPLALGEMSKAKINLSSIPNLVSSSMEGVAAIQDMAMQLSMNMDDSIMEKANSVAKQTNALLTIPTSLSEAAKNFKELEKDVKIFQGAKIAEVPVVKYIKNMIDAASHIDEQMSKVNVANVNTKLMNLGRVLGLRGFDKAETIKHEDFKIDVYVSVELDPTKLADAMVQTKRFVQNTQVR